ncbi:eukaryotic translation initiation factor 3 subunit F-1-like [Bolinopsis microptera]|uniref:eukaryotic translation initiation factor 3 subunit F-1-like n=1 Tax=Bolinopsis microptera TaxID=2820187 RepID=UPI00307AD01D
MAVEGRTVALPVRKVIIHPVVLFNIVDNYERRNDNNKRVIGTLMGRYDKGTVHVTESFAVPHQETEEEVSMDMEYAMRIGELQKKVNTTMYTVGWYSSGIIINEYSSLIHAFYKCQCPTPVHLTVDTQLKEQKMKINTHITSQLGAKNGTEGCIFTPVPHVITGAEADQVSLKFFQGLRGTRKTPNFNDQEQIINSCDDMISQINIVMGHVKKVIAGEVPSDKELGRQLMEVVQSIPNLDGDTITNMLNSHMQDLLAVEYLTYLTRQQLAISARINQIL